MFIVFHKEHGQFNPVALVDCETRADAFALTNTNQNDWWKNDGVEMLTAAPVRSTSVGDIVVNVEQVAGVGWAAHSADVRVLSRILAG